MDWYTRKYLLDKGDALRFKIVGELFIEGGEAPRVRITQIIGPPRWRLPNQNQNRSECFCDGQFTPTERGRYLQFRSEGEEATRVYVGSSTTNFEQLLNEIRRAAFSCFRNYLKIEAEVVNPLPEGIYSFHGVSPLTKVEV